MNVDFISSQSVNLTENRRLVVCLHWKCQWSSLSETSLKKKQEKRATPKTFRKLDTICPTLSGFPLFPFNGNRSIHHETSGFLFVFLSLILRITRIPTIPRIHRWMTLGCDLCHAYLITRLKAASARRKPRRSPIGERERQLLLRQARWMQRDISRYKEIFIRFLLIYLCLREIVYRFGTKHISWIDICKGKRKNRQKEE